MKITGSLALLAIVVLVPNAQAQSRQPWSIQGSGLYTAQDLGGNAGTVGGLGFEAQARRTFPKWSLGAGAQYSVHSSGGDDLGLLGLFLEPRLVLNASMGSFAPYLAGRLVYLRGSLTSDALEGDGSSSGFAIGGGAGLIYPLSRTVNIDIGGAVLHQSLGNMTLAGNEIEFPSFFGYVIKAGLSVGFEGGSSAFRLIRN